MIDRSEIRELREVLQEARVYLNTVAIPSNRRPAELIVKAIRITDDLIARPTSGDIRRARRARR
jgi:hypothetical protein